MYSNQVRLVWVVNRTNSCIAPQAHHHHHQQMFCAAGPPSSPIFLLVSTPGYYSFNPLVDVGTIHGYYYSRKYGNRSMEECSNYGPRYVDVPATARVLFKPRNVMYFLGCLERKAEAKAKKEHREISGNRDREISGNEKKSGNREISGTGSGSRYITSRYQIDYIYRHICCLNKLKTVFCIYN